MAKQKSPIMRVMKQQETGALHRDLRIKPGKKIPAKTLEKAARAKGKLGQRARFAEIEEGFKHKGAKK